MVSWSSSWKSSTQPRKQRAYIRRAPLHVRGRFLSIHLSKELREKYKRRSLRVRTGDIVRILRGDFKGKEGKVERVDVVHGKVYIHGIEQQRKDGSKALRAIHPSTLLLKTIETTDKRRIEAP